MIPHGVEVFVSLDLIELRWGFHRLSGVVAGTLRRDVRCGALFVFFGKQREASRRGGRTLFGASALVVGPGV